MEVHIMFENWQSNVLYVLVMLGAGLEGLRA